jgi:hypothetical protein
MVRTFLIFVTVVIVFAAMKLVIKPRGDTESSEEKTTESPPPSKNRLNRKPSGNALNEPKPKAPYIASIWASKKSPGEPPPPDETSTDTPTKKDTSAVQNVWSNSYPMDQRPSIPVQPAATSKTKTPGPSNKAQTFRGTGGFLNLPVTPKNSGTTPESEYYCEVSAPPGEYRTPLTLSLRCSAASKIRYCVSKDRCCNPEDGAVYKGPFRFAPGAGSYCVSIVGEQESTGKNFELTQTYSFNPDLPDLAIPEQKKFFQTTELSSSLQIESQEFGSPDRGLEVLNLGGQDPGALGLNWSCEDIVENYRTLTAPVPLVALPLYDTSTTAPTSALNLLLTTSNLFYGTNFLAVMFKNLSFGGSFGSCATERITLEDFLYFQELPTHPAALASDGSELVGGFTSVGYFADPSGSGTSDVWDPSLSALYPEIEPTMTEVFF